MKFTNRERRGRPGWRAHSLLPTGVTGKRFTRCPHTTPIPLSSPTPIGDPQGGMGSLWLPVVRTKVTGAQQHNPPQAAGNRSPALTR